MRVIKYGPKEEEITCDHCGSLLAYTEKDEYWECDEYCGRVCNVTQEHTADDTGQYRHNKNDNCPGNTDSTGLTKLFFRLERHETNNNVGHTEIAKTPAETGNNILP